MKKFKIIFLTILCVTLFSCNQKSNERIKKIGVIAPFEGSNAHIGEMIFNSVQLAFKDYNNNDIKLIPIDTKSNPSNAVSSIQSALVDTNLIAFIGFYHSSTAMAAKQIIKESKIPTLIYSASNPRVTENTNYYFRLVPTDDNQAIVLADYASKLGAKNIAILYYADEYGRGLSDGITKRVNELELNIVDIQSYDDAISDFRPLLTVLKGKNPDVIMICGFVEKSIEIINQAAEKAMNSTFLCGDGTFNEEQLINSTGKNSEGIYVAAPYVFNESNDKNISFLNKYWSEFSKDTLNKKPASWSAFAYDASNILIQALNNNFKDKGSIQNYLLKMNSLESSYEGITGDIYFNEKGDAVNKNFHLAKVQNQKFVSVE